MNIFTYNLPLDLYLTALNTILSGLMQSKIDHNNLDALPLCQFAAEMASFQSTVLQ